jgi:predicted nucleic acid-binding protein
MIVMVDTNVLLRRVEPGHPQFLSAKTATEAQLRAGHDLCVVPQVLIEFWVLCTRPTSVNGLGMTAGQAVVELIDVKRTYTILPDSPGIFPLWESLVAQYGVLGKNAHDTRLVAAMLVHGITHLLTFNTGDFTRHTGVTVLDPAAVAASATPPAP